MLEEQMLLQVSALNESCCCVLKKNVEIICQKIHGSTNTNIVLKAEMITFLILLPLRNMNQQNLRIFSATTYTKQIQQKEDNKLMAAEIVLQCVFDASISTFGNMEQRPYHRNCSCALHKLKGKNCCNHKNNSIVSFPKKQFLNHISFSITSLSGAKE
ncbi:hypothetical protein RND71_005551 [Anisodus tanguticus]|uniref:Uncharacterized protein n=1 Tax=Anisodus tanguticus TaxID=243964 RepID=A0AAE1VV33_9SOLA|nr:hypothetical protein RND71_005551 [Anisodus tanguticus]